MLLLEILCIRIWVFIGFAGYFSFFERSIVSGDVFTRRFVLGGYRVDASNRFWIYYFVAFEMRLGF